MSKVAEYSNIIDRNLDRWENAIEAARAGSYSPGRFAQDAAACWTDWALFAALPLGVVGLNVSARPAVPTVEFIVTDKTVAMKQVVEIPQINSVTAAAPENLYRPGTTAPPLIPAARITATLAGTEYVFITLDVPGIAAMAGVAANVYRGNILGTPANVPVARVKVVWPG
jgi:hypothetical protein